MKKIRLHALIGLSTLPLYASPAVAGGTIVNPITEKSLLLIDQIEGISSLDLSDYTGGTISPGRGGNYSLKSLLEKIEQQETPIYLNYANEGGGGASPGNGDLIPLIGSGKVNPSVNSEVLERAYKIQHEGIGQFQVLAVEYETFATIQEDLVKLGLFNDSIVQEDDYILIFDNQPEGAPSKATLLLPRISH